MPSAYLRCQNCGHKWNLQDDDLVIASALPDLEPRPEHGKTLFRLGVEHRLNSIHIKYVEPMQCPNCNMFAVQWDKEKMGWTEVQHEMRMVW